MAPLLQVDPRSPEPIWSQIEAGLRRLIACRRLAPGDYLPSVRDLARDLRVNPATVSRAYQRLTEAGILEARRGDGTHVAERPPGGAVALQKGLQAAAERYVSVASSSSATLDEAIAALRAAWRRLGATEDDR
jgi:GntR family transcriptional regulator